MNQESHATIWDILTEKGILLPEQLCHEEIQVDPLGQCVTMPPVRVAHVI